MWLNVPSRWIKSRRLLWVQRAVYCALDSYGGGENCITSVYACLCARWMLTNVLLLDDSHTYTSSSFKVRMCQCSRFSGQRHCCRQVSTVQCPCLVLLPFYRHFSLQSVFVWIRPFFNLVRTTSARSSQQSMQWVSGNRAADEPCGPQFTASPRSSQAR